MNINELNLFKKKNKTPEKFYDEVENLVNYLKEKDFDVQYPNFKKSGPVLVIRFNLKTYDYDKLMPQIILILNNLMNYSYPELNTDKGIKRLYFFKNDNEFIYQAAVTNLNNNILEVEFSCYDNKANLTESSIFDNIEFI